MNKQNQIVIEMNVCLLQVHHSKPPTAQKASNSYIAGLNACIKQARHNAAVIAPPWATFACLQLVLTVKWEERAQRSEKDERGVGRVKQKVHFNVGISSKKQQVKR
jgi:hypothetical protein